MLWRSSPAVQHCQGRAAECNRLAELANNPETRKGYETLAESWRALAENHEFIEKMDRFLGYARGS